jgi:predicted translin family RNA/ssDNA-binding protein
VAKWDADHDRLVQVHREDTFNRLRYFYNVVRELYAGTSTLYSPSALLAYFR